MKKGEYSKTTGIVKMVVHRCPVFLRMLNQVSSLGDASIAKQPGVITPVYNYRLVGKKIYPGLTETS